MVFAFASVLLSVAGVLDKLPVAAAGGLTSAPNVTFFVVVEVELVVVDVGVEAPVPAVASPISTSSGSALGLELLMNSGKGAGNWKR